MAKNHEKRWTDNQLKYAKQLRGHVHTAPIYKQLYRDDRAAYEAFLTARYGRGITSSTHLDIDQLLDLNKWLRGKGTQEYHPPSGEKIGTRSVDNVHGMVSRPQREKINRLGSMVEWRVESGFQLWLERRGGYPKTDAEAFNMIEALKAMYERQIAKQFGPDWQNHPDLPFAARRYVQLHGGGDATA